MIKNYMHNVIRLRKGKPSLSQVYWIVVILNKKKANSHKQIEQLGFFKQGKEKLFSINYQRLAYYLNKGFKLKCSIKKYIYGHSIFFNKFYKLNRLNNLKKFYKLLFKKTKTKTKKKKKKKIFDVLKLYRNYNKIVNEFLYEKNKAAIAKQEKRQKAKFLGYKKKHKGLFYTNRILFYERFNQKYTPKPLPKIRIKIKKIKKKIRMIV